MPFQRKRPALTLSEDVRSKLVSLTSSRTAAAARVERARIVLAYADTESVSSIARRLRTNRPKPFWSAIGGAAAPVRFGAAASISVSQGR
jgi:hypothetical protein